MSIDALSDRPTELLECTAQQVNECLVRILAGKPLDIREVSGCLYQRAGTIYDKCDAIVSVERTTDNPETN